MGVTTQRKKRGTKVTSVVAFNDTEDLDMSDEQSEELQKEEKLT